MRGEGIIMKNLVQKITRPCGKITDNIIIASILSVVVLSIGAGITSIGFDLLGVQQILSDWLESDNLGIFLSDYLSFAGIWIAVFLFVVIPKGNRPMLKAWGHNRNGNNIKGIIAGILLGFGTNAICVLISWLRGDIKLSYYGFEPVILLAFLGAVFIQSGAEELIDRLYLYQKLRRRYRNPLVAIIINSLVFIQSGAEELVDRFYLYQKLRRRYRSPLIAIIVNSAVFMALHILNPGFTAIAGSQIFLVGIIFSLFVYYYDSLWAAMWFHAAWNFTQNLIFGLPNSGIVSEYSIFKLEAATATNGLFYDVKFGVEGSIGSSIILGVLLIVLIIINRRKGEKTDIWEAAEETAAEKREADQRRKEKYQSKHAAS